MKGEKWEGRMEAKLNSQKEGGRKMRKESEGGVKASRREVMEIN